VRTKRATHFLDPGNVDGPKIPGNVDGPKIPPRGRNLVGKEADRVTETALANHVVNSDPDGVDHGLESKPLLVFAVCYVTAHLALDLIDEKRAEAILNYCEEHLVEGS
jgi:hypothetical protein